MTTDQPSPSAFPVSPAQLTVLLLCVVSIYFIIGFYGKSLESYRINQRAAQIRQEIAELEAANEVLRARVALYATDAYVETTARDKLNLARPGDRTLIVRTQDEEVAGVEGPPPSGTGSGRSEFGHLADWLALFAGPR
jgi:cell division protein FtsB